MPVSNIKGFRKFGKVVIDVNLECNISQMLKKNLRTHILKTASVCGKTFVQRNRETLVVLPV